MRSAIIALEYISPPTTGLDADELNKRNVHLQRRRDEDGPSAGIGLGDRRKIRSGCDDR